MFKVIITTSNGRVFCGEFSTEIEAQAWLDAQVDKSDRLPEREKDVSQCSEEELDSALEIIPEVLGEGDELISPAQAVLPAEFSSSITDITAQKAQEAINEQAKAFLRDTDWKVLRHIRQKALEDNTTLSEDQYLELEQERKEASLRIM